MSESQIQVKKRKFDRRTCGTQLLREAKEFLCKYDYKGAADKLREGVYLYSDSECWHILEWIKNRLVVEMTDDDWGELTREAQGGCANSQFYLAFLGSCDNPFFPKLSLNDQNEMLEKASGQGHGYAAYLLGGHFYDLAFSGLTAILHPELEEGYCLSRALSLWRLAETRGVSDASNDLSNYFYSFRKGEGLDLEQYVDLSLLHADRGAQLGNKECLDRIDRIVMKYPRETAPWSIWSPRLHRRCPRPVRRAIFTWLVIACRTGILPKDVVLMICGFVCTETKNERFCDKWPL